MVNPQDSVTLTESYMSMHQKILNWGYYKLQVHVTVHH